MLLELTRPWLHSWSCFRMHPTQHFENKCNAINGMNSNRQKNVEKTATFSTVMSSIYLSRPQYRSDRNGCGKLS